MNFKQLLVAQKFYFVSGCISHRHYDNGIYKIEVVNITGIATLLRNGDIVDTFNIHDQNLTQCKFVY